MSIEDGSQSGHPIIVKIGGSLITHKAGFCELNSAKVGALGEEIAGLDPDLRRRLIVILGGGSFSHGIALKYGLHDAPPAVRTDLSRLTIGMFRMISTIVDMWRDRGVAAYPIQPGTQVCTSDGKLRFIADQFVTAMKHDLVPVTTGDIALLSDRSSRSLSGDWLAVLLAREIRIASAVFMTDVPGVIDRGSGVAFRTISLRSPELARRSAVGSSHPDVTGGMAAKLEAALALATLGVPSRIVDGRGGGALTAVLSGVGWSGTEVMA